MRYTLLDLPPSRTDWTRLRRRTRREIEAALRDDPDAGPPTDAEFWMGAQPATVPPKQAISIRIDQDVLDWFRSLGRGYQTRINAVLRAHVEARRRRAG